MLVSALIGYKRIWVLEIEGKGHTIRPEHSSKTCRRAVKLTENLTDSRHRKAIPQIIKYNMCK